MTVKPWIKAADDAGPLTEGAADFLSCMLVPNTEGRLVTLPAETWQGMWRLMHMARVIDQLDK